MVETNGLTTQEQARQTTGFSSGWSDPNSGYVDQQTENERIVQEDPDGDGVPNSTIYLWNPNALNTQGLFPSRFPSSVTRVDDLIKLIREGMSYAERLSFKRKLWAAGFYTDNLTSPSSTLNKENQLDTTSGLRRRENLTGAWENGDEDAIKKLIDVQKTANQNNKGRTGTAIDLDSAWIDQLSTVSQQSRDDLVDQYNLGGLSLQLQDWARKNLGRSLKDEEVQKVLMQTLAFDREPGEISSTTSEWSAANTEMDPLSRRQLVAGGGPDSSAINFGRGLASTYNLVVDAALTMTPKMIGATSEFEDAFREGRAVKITGDRQRMIKLHEWAQTQNVDNGIFDNVRFIYENNSNEPSGLLLSMNEGAKIPPMATTDFSYGQRGSDLDKFLDSIKRPGDVDAYKWEGEGPNRRGAYGMSDQIWEHYSNQLNIDSGDTSITAQDRVARAYVSDLWSRYGSWKEVALALRVNEDTANRRRVEREAQGDGYVDVVTDPSELSWAEKAIAKMGYWKPVLDASKSKDLYESMYGNNAAYIPANVFSGIPNPGEQTENKMAFIAQKLYGTEISATKVLEDVMKTAGQREWIPYTGERKWKP
jgi:hypothetical protein